MVLQRVGHDGAAEHEHRREGKDVPKDRKTGKRKNLFPSLGKVERHVDISTSVAI